MSESRFTPGPWTADHFDDGDWLVRSHGTETIVAESPAGIHGLSMGESHAIGNLISAAPDMYEALKEFIGSLYFERNTEASKRKALAAIAKAENGYQETP